ncbi:hypothetical protein [Ulvibacter litoralis]|uniref:Carboxypeptidase regulatory-like domain-containing protein n=1 Tax=Ulvibacter litoralis TaxID=227084 RepID=A0A1G7JVI1_9FLAO|nr:hypothetical protein [Ulvibacter litoralis]GHC65538.1 hypothetical protein GCM10008083_33420 [Ulvibacter litoralis]SDF28960.1 hypothetical protein SAMN05421855_1322 [Ulvibacter litoralis]
MKYKKLIIGLLITASLMSCDCWVIINGKVIDAQSKEPIERVRLEFLNINSTEIINSTITSQEVNRIFSTDSTGIFFMRSDNYGFCPNIEPKIKIWKEGYKTKEFIVTDDIPRNELVIELEKE